MKIFIRFLLSVFLLGMPSCASSAPVQVSIIGRVCTLQAGECAAEYLKKAYAGLVYDSAKVIVENNNTRYEQADPKLFWDGLWWSFLAGVLLMLSSIGLFIYIFMLGLMHLFRFKELFLMLTAGISFVAGFTLFFAVCRYYTFQIMQLFDLFSVQLFFLSELLRLLAGLACYCWVYFMITLIHSILEQALDWCGPLYNFWGLGLLLRCVCLVKRMRHFFCLLGS